MSNTSYCRFENTFGDLQDCIRQLDGMRDGDSAEPLSDSEKRYAKKLVELMKEFISVAGEDSADQDGDFDVDALIESYQASAIEARDNYDQGGMDD